MDSLANGQESVCRVLYAVGRQTCERRDGTLARVGVLNGNEGGGRGAKFFSQYFAQTVLVYASLPGWWQSSPPTLSFSAMTRTGMHHTVYKKKRVAHDGTVPAYISKERVYIQHLTAPSPLPSKKSLLR